MSKYRVWYDHKTDVYFDRLTDCWHDIRCQDTRSKYGIVGGQLVRITRRLYRRKSENGSYDSIDVYLSKRDMIHDRDGSHPFASIQVVKDYKRD
jgi:hypothetical protein